MVLLLPGAAPVPGPGPAGSGAGAGAVASPGSSQLRGLTQMLDEPPRAVKPPAQKKATAQKKTTAQSKATGPGRRLIPASRSGLPWASGVYIPGSSPARTAAFGAWRGAPVDVAEDWAARATWNDVINPDWLYRAWAGTPYTKVFGIAPVPEQDPTATMARCAAGDYADKWRQFGRNISAAGLADGTVIRLGWEFNGNWYKWSAYDPAQYARCWRSIVDAVRPLAPGLLWDWSVNRGVGSSVADPTRAYPGDGYVDIVGVDSYDMFPGVTSEATWKVHYAGTYGLRFWADFAAAHGKKLSVAEWGVYPGTAHTGHNGGDNALYISKMRAFFADQGSRLAYEAYFNESAGYYAGSLHGPTQVPAAAARYRALFGG